jgi:hypothetical protein
MHIWTEWQLVPCAVRFGLWWLCLTQINIAMLLFKCNSFENRITYHSKVLLLLQKAFAITIHL